MKKLILFFGILCSYGLSAQVYVIDNGTVTTTCSGIFVDTGGNTAPYSSNESFTYTICPENPGQLVQLEFTDFDTLAGADIMTIFNADNATDPTTTLGEYSGNTFAESPGFISATSENPSGCLTIVFTSSPAAADNGWVANVTCFVPCQTILSQIDSAVPTPNADGYIRVCPNDEITLTGSGQFSTSDVGATYQWDLGDGTTQNGKTATFSYTTPGVYLVNLNISDTNASNDPSGCKNTNLLNQVIQVAFPTDFTGTAAESTVLCYGESMTITGIATPVPVLNQCTPPESQETFLPDGNGTSYETSIVVDCFNSDQTLDSIDQLVNICLEMEHSYLADLDISIVSPTGQTVKLHNSGTGVSANLGVPWATAEADSQSDVLTPGEGYQYCFLVDNTLPTLAGGVENGGVFIVGDGTDTYIDSFVPAGSYSSANPLSGLLGSSLNGSWTIKIKDLPYLNVGPYHTNTVAGLQLAMDLLRRKRNTNKQIFMITDGKPSCLKLKDGSYYKNSNGLDSHIVDKCYNMAQQARRLNIPITTFMIAQDPYLKSFVQEFTKANKGKAFYTGLKGLGEMIFEDYETNRKKRI